MTDQTRMIFETDFERARDTRSALWAKACRREITVDELYARLAELRRVAGEELYRIPRIGRR